MQHIIRSFSKNPTRLNLLSQSKTMLKPTQYYFAAGKNSPLLNSKIT